MNQEDGYLTAKEAADYLHLSKTWGFQAVLRWARENKIRVARVGRAVRFKKADIDDFAYSKK